MAALVRPGEATSLGRLGAQTIGTMAGLLLGFGVLTLALGPQLLDLFSFPPSFAASISQIDTPAGLAEAGALPAFEQMGVATCFHLNSVCRTGFVSNARKK